MSATKKNSNEFNLLNAVLLTFVQAVVTLCQCVRQVPADNLRKDRRHGKQDGQTNDKYSALTITHTYSHVSTALNAAQLFTRYAHRFDCLCVGRALLARLTAQTTVCLRWLTESHATCHVQLPTTFTLCCLLGCYKYRAVAVLP